MAQFPLISPLDLQDRKILALADPTDITDGVNLRVLNNHVVQSDSEPTTNLVDGTLWVDTSANPPNLHVYNEATSMFDEIAGPEEDPRLFIQATEPTGILICLLYTSPSPRDS